MKINLCTLLGNDIFAALSVELQQAKQISMVLTLIPAAFTILLCFRHQSVMYTTAMFSTIQISMLILYTIYNDHSYILLCGLCHLTLQLHHASQLCLIFPWNYQFNICSWLNGNYITLIHHQGTLYSFSVSYVQWAFFVYFVCLFETLLLSNLSFFKLLNCQSMKCYDNQDIAKIYAFNSTSGQFTSMWSLYLSQAYTVIDLKRLEIW